MIFTDKVSTSAVRRTSDGYLVADAAVARTGIQHYLGSEVGKPDMPVVRVYRSPDEVFAKDAMKSYAHRPMTNDHPSAPVNSDNWKDLAIGNTGGDVMRDGEYVRVPLVVMDSSAISQWEDGKKELSMGYSAEIVFQPGVTDSGEEYDAVQKSLRMNHLALVSRARGGDKLRIGDTGTAGISPLAHNDTGGHMADLRKVVVDGLTIETTDQGAQVIEKLNAKVADADSKADALISDHAKAIAAKDTEIGELTAKLKDAESKQMTDAEIDARVAERAELVAKAKAIVDADYTGKSDAEIRKSVVVAKLGDSTVEGKSAEFIAGCFAMLGDSAAADPVRNAVMRDGVKNAAQVKDNGYAESVAAHQFNATKEA